jgi:hypothetical protein
MDYRSDSGGFENREPYEQPEQGTYHTGETWGTSGMFQPTHFRKGMDVYSSDDQKVCSVDEVFNNYLMCKKGMFFGQDVYIPFQSVTDVREGRAYVNMPKDQFNQGNWFSRPSDLGQPYDYSTQTGYQTGYQSGETYGGGTGMFRASQFHKGMDIYGSDDRKVCSVDDVYNNYIVCKSGPFFGKDLYVPFSEITDVREGRAYLSMPGDQVKNSNWFTQPSNLGQPYYGGQTIGGPSGQTWSGTPGSTGQTWGTQSGMSTFNATHFRKGTDVYSSDDHKIGTVDDVFNGYLLCKKGMIFTSDLYVPFSAVRDVSNDRVYLDVPKDQLDNLNWTQPPSDLGQSYFGEGGSQTYME